MDEPLVVYEKNNLVLKGEGNVIISGASKILKEDNYPNSIFVNGVRRNKTSAYKVESSAWNRCEREDFIFHNPSEILEDRTIYNGFLTTHKELLYENPENIEYYFTVGWNQNIANGHLTKLENDKIYIELEQSQFNILQKKGLRVGAPTEIRNIKSALQEGTFYHDKSTSAIEYLPTENEIKTGYEILYPVIETLLRISNSKNIKISNISFRFTTWEYPSKNGLSEIQSTTYDSVHNSSDEIFTVPKAAVFVAYSEDVKFEGCEFSNLGGTGIHIGRGCKNNSIINSKLYDIAGGAVIVGNFEDKDAHPNDYIHMNFNTRIENNVIHDIGVLYNGACGILAGYVNSIKIYNNLLYNIAYTGISVGWGWGRPDPFANLIFNSNINSPNSNPTILKNNHIRGNEIHHIMQQMHDGAGIYTLSNQDGSVIEDNYIHDNSDAFDEPITKIYVKKAYLLGVTTKYGRLSKRKGFPGGIYLDECSSGITVRNNRIENVAVNYFYHDTGVPGIFESNFFDVEKLDNPILSYDS
ncbi:MAG: right-handed parallel beta-helix repeat-containing protein [Clostridia bacterium]